MMRGHEMDSAFVSHKFSQREEEEVTKTWAYIGRFMWGFAIIEEEVDDVLYKLFNLNSVAFLLLVGNLDLRKKLKFLEVGFKYKGIDEREAINMIHEVHDVRNLLVHCRFTPDYGNAEDIHGDGIEFQHVSSSGKLTHPRFEAGETTICGFVLLRALMNSAKLASLA